MSVESLLQHPDVWRGREREAPAARGPSIPSGYEELDAALPGGWPEGALTEILIGQKGIGELRLLMPALAELSRSGRWVAWIAPPYVPYAPALAGHGIDLSRVLLIHTKRHQDSLWTVEQALRSGTCGAVLAWPRRADDRSLRRLQLAAEAGGAWGILFRSRRDAAQPSPAALRLGLEPAHESGMDRLNVHPLKQRGGYHTGPVSLDVGQPTQSELDV